jgi:hypothetical protein
LTGGRTYEGLGIQLLEQLNRLLDLFHDNSAQPQTITASSADLTSTLHSYIQDFTNIQVLSELKIIFQSKVLATPIGLSKWSLDDIENQEAIRKINEHLLKSLSEIREDSQLYKDLDNQDSLDNQNELSAQEEAKAQAYSQQIDQQ